MEGRGGEVGLKGKSLTKSVKARGKEAYKEARSKGYVRSPLFAGMV